MVSKTRAMLMAFGAVCLLISYSAGADQPNQTAQTPTSFWTRDALFGSWDGLKPWLSNNGITVGVTEQAVTSNVLGGGARQGNEFAALLTPSARIDLGRYTGIPGLAAYVSAWVVQGRGPTAYNVHSLSGLAYAPPAQNVITLDAQAGLMLDAPFAGRPDDTAALAVSYDRISARKIAFTRAENTLASGPLPIPVGETDVELDYNTQFAPWLTATPELQYIVRPGGGIANPSNPPRREPNVIVAQLQMTITL